MTPEEQIMWVFDDNWKIFLSVLHKNTCCGYSLEAPHWGASNEYPQHVFLWRNKKKCPLILSKTHLIRSTGLWPNCQALWQVEVLQSACEVLQTLYAVSTAQAAQDYENNDFVTPSEKHCRVSGLKSGLKKLKLTSMAQSIIKLYF